jgi:hypothetical protein
MFQSIRLVLEIFDENVAAGMPQEEAEEMLAIDCWTLMQFPIPPQKEPIPEHITNAIESGWIDEDMR